MTDALLPPEALATVSDVDTALKKVEDQLSTVLPDCTRAVMDQLTYLERASALLTLSKTANTLFRLYLRTDGLDPDKHSAKSELERVDLYQDKVQAALGKSTGPRRPTTNLDIRAANRFIEHAIPGLPDDQRKQIRELSKKGNLKRHQEKMPASITPKRRPSGLTIAEEAAAFLAEASKEIQAASLQIENKNRLVNRCGINNLVTVDDLQLETTENYIE